MQHDEYKMITTGTAGRVRGILKSAASKRPLTRSTLAALLDEAGVTDERTRSNIAAEAARLAGRVANGEKPFIVQQHADAYVLAFAKAERAADDLLGRDPDPGPDPAETDAAASAVMNRGRHPWESDAERAARRADEAERERLKALGFRPDPAA